MHQGRGAIDAKSFFGLISCDGGVLFTGPRKRLVSRILTSCHLMSEFYRFLAVFKMK